MIPLRQRMIEDMQLRGLSKEHKLPVVLCVEEVQQVLGYLRLPPSLRAINDDSLAFVFIPSGLFRPSLSQVC